MEVSNLEGNNFLELTDVFSQTMIPASKGNIQLMNGNKYGGAHRQ